jgi:hypothetical protein
MSQGSRRGGEDGGRGRQRPPDHRRAQQGAGREERQVTQSGAQQRQVHASVPAAGERPDGADQGVHGERRAHRHRAQGRGQEARGEVSRLPLGCSEEDKVGFGYMLECGVRVCS